MDERSAISVELAQRLVDELQRDRRATQLTFRLMNFALLLSILFIPNSWETLQKNVFMGATLVGINAIWALNTLHYKRKISESISVVARYSYDFDRDFFRSLIEIREAERFSPFRRWDLFEPMLWMYLTAGILALIFYRF